MATYESKRYAFSGAAISSIAATSLADGTVTNAEYQYINTLGSNAQTQLNARLQLAGGTMTGGIDLNDNIKTRWGTDNDLEIYHDDSNAYIKNGSGYLKILEDNVEFKNNADSSTFLAINSSGATVTGTLAATAVTGNGSGLTNLPAGVGGATGVDFNDNVKARWGTGNDLEIYHDASNSIIADAGTGALQLRGGGVNLMKADGSGSMLTATDGGAVELHYNGSKKAETVSGGLTVTGTLTATTVNGAPTDEDAIGAVAFAYYSPSNSVVNIARGSTTAGSGLYVRTDSTWVVGNLNSSADPGENKPFSATGGTSTTLSGTWLCLNPCRRYNQGGHTNWSMGHFVRVS